MSTSSQIRKRAKKEQQEFQKKEEQRQRRDRGTGLHAALWLGNIVLAILFAVWGWKSAAAEIPTIILELVIFAVLIISLFGKAGKADRYIGVWCYMIPLFVGISGTFRYVYIRGSLMPGISLQTLYIWIIALAIAITAIIHYFRRKKFAISTDSEKQTTHAVAILLILGCVLVSAYGQGPMLNDAFPAKETKTAVYTVDSKSSFFGNFVFHKKQLGMSAKDSRISVYIDSDDADKIKNGDKIRVEVRKGIFGTEYADHVEKQIMENESASK